MTWPNSLPRAMICHVVHLKRDCSHLSGDKRRWSAEPVLVLKVGSLHCRDLSGAGGRQGLVADIAKTARMT